MERSTFVFGICLLIIGLITIDTDPLTAAVNLAFGVSLLIYPVQKDSPLFNIRHYGAYTIGFVATALMILVITVDILT